MGRLSRLLRSLRVRRLWQSLLRKLRRWLVGMAERCCRARRCGLVSLVVVNREVSRLRVRAAVVIVIAETVVVVGGIAGVGAMSSEDVEASATMLRGPMRCRQSSMRSLVG